LGSEGHEHSAYRKKPVRVRPDSIPGGLAAAPSMQSHVTQSYSLRQSASTCTRQASSLFLRASSPVDDQLAVHQELALSRKKSFHVGTTNSNYGHERPKFVSDRLKKLRRASGFPACSRQFVVPDMKKISFCLAQALRLDCKLIRRPRKMLEKK